VQIPEFTQSFNRYSYCLNNPLKYTDPSGQWSDVIGIDDWLDVDDWYLNLENGRVEYRAGNKNRIKEGLVWLAADNATFSDIANALTERNYKFINDGGFKVETEKQYKAWMMMNILSPDNIGAIFGIAGFESNIASKGAATAVSRTNAILLREVQVTAKAEGNVFRSFTSANFRTNLGRLTGEIPTGSQAHHVFPQEFVNKFTKIGININDPKFGVWWETTSHLKNAKTYNAMWKNFLIDNPTLHQTLDKGRSMLQLYDLPVGF
jgi:hypothetical protein